MVARWRVALGTALAVACFAGPASAENCPIEYEGVGMGAVIPGPECRTTFHSDVHVSAITENWVDYAPRGTLEVGALWGVPAAEGLHLGPMLAISGSGVSESGDTTLATFDPSIRLRGRMWIPTDGERILFVEAATGPTLSVPAGPDDPLRVGAYGELGLNVHGLIGGFFAVEPTVSTDDDSVVTRYSLGLKTTAAGFAIAVAVYLCAEARCS
ncbi:MAG: hypothetical protein HOV80_20585 [Polyangiaceae bacterium]|nr:hypothetical protein [Polyangiaceae bacterium]